MAGFGGTIKLQGASEYKKAVSDINANLKLLSSEMKLTASTFDKSDKSAEGLKKTSDGLNKQIEKQKEKISAINDALSLATEKYGENSTQVVNWKAKLNEAEGGLNDLNRELDNFQNEEDKAGQGAIKLGDLIKANLISDAVVAGIKAMASAMVEVGKACVDVGKQAVESYASYEQLTGGVETLFGESSKTVEKYANDAYKTAGLSANEYMETVTSFSASLLQSLNGDTAKSAQVADQAIIDMADNANKMGTSMESIQSAYQGFAKGNYTLLDNLKLGKLHYCSV